MPAATGLSSMTMMKYRVSICPPFALRAACSRALSFSCSDISIYSFLKREASKPLTGWKKAFIAGISFTNDVRRRLSRLNV